MTTPERSVAEVVEEFRNLYVEIEEVMERSVLDKYEHWLTQTLQAERQKREEVVELLNFVWTRSDNFVFEGVTEGSQKSYWHCRGCDGEFESNWPRWEEPTEETFPHKKTCFVLKVQEALTKSNNK